MAVATGLIHLPAGRANEKRNAGRSPDACWSPSARAMPLKQAGLNYLGKINLAELAAVVAATMLSLMAAFSLLSWIDGPAQSDQHIAMPMVSSVGRQHDRYLVQQLQELSTKVDALSRDAQEHRSDLEE